MDDNDRPDPKIERLKTKAAYHRERAQFWRERSTRRFDNAPGSFVTGSAGRRRSGLARRSEKAIAGSFEDGRKARYHEGKAAHYEAMIAYWQAAPARQAAAQRAVQTARAERQALRRAPVKDRLFIYGCMTGICYCDRSRERAGDWIRLAILFEDNLQLVLEGDCPDEFKPLIEADAKSYQDRRGQLYEVSTSGQTVTLGYALKDGEPIPPTSTRRVLAGRRQP